MQGCVQQYMHVFKLIMCIAERKIREVGGAVQLVA